MNSDEMKNQANASGGADLSSFRFKRGSRLAAFIDDIAQDLGRSVRILDVGGRPLYWRTVRSDNIAKITLLNLESSQFRGEDRVYPIECKIGNGCDLSSFDPGAFDFYHSNSVIEHVGGWENVMQFAAQARRIGIAGWMQTPAWEFPIEPHLRVPFLHWLARPAQKTLVRRLDWWNDYSLSGRRALVDSINLLSKSEVRALFPHAEIWTERLMGLPKSYVAHWRR